MRDEGDALADDDLDVSDLILPPADLTFAEAARSSPATG